MTHSAKLPVLLLVFVLGCGSQATPTTVKGTVTLDQQPLNEGELTFVPQDGGVPTTLPIKNGMFDGQIVPNKYRIEVRAYRQTSGDTTGGGMYKAGEIEAPRENYIPAKYNTESTFSEEIGKQGKTDLAFAVTSR